MTRTSSAPIGFGGTVQQFEELLRPAASVHRLPAESGVAGAAVDAIEQIEVRPLTERMGPIEALLRQTAAQLVDGGRLVLEVENCQSLRRLRMALEGRPGALEPHDDPADPGQALPLRRVLQAMGAAGLLVRDVVRVPGWNGVGPEFAGTIFREGFVATAWLDGAPSARFWLQAAKEDALAGSVLIGPGGEAEQERTAAALQAFLPADWEIVRAEEPVEEGVAGEAVGWNRAVAESEGELLWFLRAGTVPGAALFTALAAAAEVGPAVPGRDGQRAAPGDLSGLMAARTDVLLTGPVSEEWRNGGIAFEDWLMRLDCVAPPTEVVDGELAQAAPTIAAPAVFALEGEAMLARWQPLVRGKPCWESSDDPVARAAAERPAPWAGREPRISLCMIARNEQRFLPECLAAVRSAVDEIVIVDTGSTDDTVAIAESFGARVLHQAWDDDFSAPRNTGLRAATGDWILVLDADEIVDDRACARIRELVRDPGVCGYHLHFINNYGTGKTLGVMMVRLFRNLPGLEYQNVIHEQVTPSLLRIGHEQGLILSLCDVEVLHHGYTDEVMGSKNKNERNERLFKKQLARQPDDIYGLYKFGDFLRRLPGRQHEARDLLERCLRLILAGPVTLPRELPYAGEVAALCALEYAREDQHERAREIVSTALRRFVPTPNLHYITAGLCLHAGRNDEAIAHYRRCLSYRGQVLVVPIQEGITGHVALAGIAQACLQKGDLERAERLLRRAIELEPSWEVSHLALSRLHLGRGEPQAALTVLADFLARRPDSAGACQQTTLILHRMGLTDQALRMGRRALQLLQADARDHEAKHMERILAAIT